MPFARRFFGLAALLLASAGPGHALDLQSTTAPGRAVPSLTAGELAINRADRTLFFKNVDGSLARGALMDATAAGRKTVEQGDGSDLAARAPGATASRLLSDFLGSAQFNVPTIAVLRAWPIAPLVANAGVRVSGYYDANDGGGSDLTWSPTSTDPDDGCVVFKPTGVTGAGRWLRSAAKSGSINVLSCGAKPDGTDAAPRINVAVLAAEARINTANYWGPSGVARVYVPAGQWLVSGVDIHRGIKFGGDGPSATKFVLAAGANRSVIASSAAPQTDPAQWSTFGQPTLEGFSIDGNASAQTGTSHGIEFTDAVYTIATRYGTAGRIENIDINGTLTSGIYAGKNRNLGFATKVIIQYANNYGINFNGSYDWSITDSSIGVSKVAGINLYYAGAITITNTAIYGNIGPGIQVQEGFGFYLWMTGGCLEGNTTHGLAIIPPAGSSNGVIGLTNVHLINNSAAADNTSSHIYVRNFSKLSLSNVTARVHPSTNPGAKYIIDNDSSAPVVINNLMYDTLGSEVPYKTAPFATPGLIVGAANPMSGTFGLYSPFMVRATNGVDLYADFDGGSARAQMQVYTGGTPAGHGSGFYDLLLQPKGGNLGVGTTAPGAKLDVAGTMRGQMLVLSGAPTASNIPASVWTVVKRTDDASVKICANDNGTIKCAAMQ